MVLLYGLIAVWLRFSELWITAIKTMYFSEDDKTSVWHHKPRQVHVSGEIIDLKGLY